MSWLPNNRPRRAFGYHYLKPQPRNKVYSCLLDELYIFMDCQLEIFEIWIYLITHN